MAFTLDTIVPWGRSYAEYVTMFGLTAHELQQRILGCADGPAGFNALLTQAGGNVVSVDPLYAYDAATIAQRITETFPVVLAQTQQNHTEFVWSTIPSVTHLANIRHQAMNVFLADYTQGLAAGRYRCMALPTLALKTNSFDLALCSHLLFLYSAQLSLEFHFNAIMELCRVASEVRIFPVFELGAQPSRHLAPLLSELAAIKYPATLVTVAYEFQRGANQMLQIKRAS